MFLSLLQSITYGAVVSESLLEDLARLDSVENTRSVVVVGERLDVDSLLAVVLNVGVLGRGKADGGSNGEDGGLHCECSWLFGEGSLVDVLL